MSDNPCIHRYHPLLRWGLGGAVGDSMAGAQVEQRTTAMIIFGQGLLFPRHHPISLHGLFEFMFMTSYDVDAIIILRKQSLKETGTDPKPHGQQMIGPGLGGGGRVRKCRRKLRMRRDTEGQGQGQSWEGWKPEWGAWGGETGPGMPDACLY